MELRAYLNILRRRWLMVALVALSALALAAVVTLLMTPRYTATTRLFFGVEGTGSAADLAQGSTFAEKQMTSYAEVATSPLVLGSVIERLDLAVGPADLADKITASVPSDTVILEVSVSDTDPGRAAQIANAVGAELSDVAASLSPERADGTQALRATVLAPAVVPGGPSSPNVPRNLGLGLLVGLLLGVGLAILQQLMNTKIRNDQDVRALSDSPILGAIAFDQDVPSHPVMVAEQPLGAPAEAIRRLRTNLQFVGAGTQSKSLVVTSSVPGEGKSTTAINLAVSLADAGSRVILVDADLRRPSVADYLGLEGRAGLTTVLIGRADLEDVIQPWRDSGLHILPSGQVPPNPSELLGSTVMVDLLAKLESDYDVVLLDTPPLLPVTDATILTKLVGGAIVVVGADRIHKAQLAEALETLEIAGAQLHGLVLNKIARRDANPYVYENGYYSSKVEEDAPTSPPTGLPVPPTVGPVPERAGGATVLAGGKRG